MNNTQLFIGLVCFLLSSSSLLSQGTQVEFGKNRVQYHRDFDEWSQYESDNFVVFWYGRSRNIGEAVVQLAEYDFDEVQRSLEHRMNEKVQIVVYADLTDFKQSNIGQEEVFGNVAGQTKIIGNSLFVYYDGDHSHLRKQIREGIASVYLNTMLFGANFQEVIQNAVSLNLPLWFTQGLVAYLGEPWNTDVDNALREQMLDPKFKGFGSLASSNPRLMGNALWYFIRTQYTPKTVSNLLYLTRINRSVEGGFQYVMGVSLNEIVLRCERFFLEKYKADQASRKMPPPSTIPIKNKKQVPVTKASISPNGRFMTYLTNDKGKIKLYLQEVSGENRTLIYRQGVKNVFQATDYQYPLVSWSPSGKELAILTEKKDKLSLGTYNIETKKLTKEPLAEQYQRIYSMDFYDPFTLLFSADVSSQADIFLYSIRTRQTQRITNDYFDDKDASAVNIGNKRGILFVSNREDSLLRAVRRDTLLPLKPFDVFYYDMETRGNELVRVTNTPFANERKPISIDTTHFAFLSDRSGIMNRETGFLETYIHHITRHVILKDGIHLRFDADSIPSGFDTTLIDSIYLEPVYKKRAFTGLNSNYDRNILDHYDANGYQVYSLMYREKKYQIISELVDPTVWVKSAKVRGMENSSLPVLALPNITPSGREIAKKSEINAKEEPLDEKYLFQTPFGTPVKKIESPVAAPLDQTPSGLLSGNSIFQKPVYRLRPTQLIPYRTQFHTDYVVTQMDNSLLFGGLDQFAATADGFTVPPAGMLMKVNLKDLFEDHEFEGGIRVPTAFNGAEYFFLYHNRKHRLDKRWAFYMKDQRNRSDASSYIPQRDRYNILLGQFTLRYPFDIFRSLRGSVTLRRDQNVPLATDAASYTRQVTAQPRIGARLEYVFDNSLETGLNLRSGARYKFFAEFVKKFDFSTNANGGQSLTFSKGVMSILGVDARFYQPILKHSVWATRIAGSTVAGSEKILYFLGGVDNWLMPQRDDEISIPPGNFAFQTLAANLRGFKLNTRNGNNYLLINSELRVPVAKYIFKNISSQLIRNFQIVGFFDVGSAWTGFNPYRADNPLNTRTYKEGETITVTVNYFRDPIAASYGVGLRTKLFGYFVRADYGYGIETRIIQKPILHVSMGLDF
jgi:Tol biopolymer transport system component